MKPLDRVIASGENKLTIGTVTYLGIISTVGVSLVRQMIISSAPGLLATHTQYE